MKVLENGCAPPATGGDASATRYNRIQRPELSRLGLVRRPAGRVPDRFWDQVRADHRSGCWVWIGRPTRDGYSKFAGQLGHRYLWLRVVGPIAEGLQLDHLCRVKLCVNPAHLEPVTLAENVRRRQLLITHCIRGHRFDAVNTWRNARGYRHCRACARRRRRAYTRAARCAA